MFRRKPKIFEGKQKNWKGNFDTSRPWYMSVQVTIFTLI